MNRRLFALLLSLALLSTGTAFAGSRVTIVVRDAAGFGFNDTTAAQPVGGNPGTTIGEQRMNVVKRAAEVWGQHLDSNVEITINVGFTQQSCNANSAVLASAGPTEWHADFTNAPQRSTWYPAALANKLAGSDLNAALHDIRAQFNTFSNTGCGFKWYYGLDGADGQGEDMLVVALHEFGHGLGVTSSSSLANGTMLRGMPSIYEKHLFDGTTNQHWDQLSADQRILSSINDQNVFWNGTEVKRSAVNFLLPTPFLRVNAPASVARNFTTALAGFGGRSPVAGLTGAVVAPTDPAEPADPTTDPATAAGTTTDGCSTYDNPAAVAGKFVLVDRGRCAFVLKAQVAQAAGAIGILIADNRAGTSPPGMSGADPNLTIPVMSVTQADGVVLRAQINNGLNFTFTADPQRLAGASADGKVRVYAPTELAGGSSIHHWDTSALPNLLMEPNINADLSPTGVDLTLQMLLDQGWTTSITPGQNPVQPNPGPPSGRRILRRGR